MIRAFLAVELSEDLRKQIALVQQDLLGGNIGYGIDEAYRGHHYASKACKLLFTLAKKHELSYLLITCDPENMASSKTCQLTGGKYIETADIPQDHEMFTEGKRKVMIYRFDM